MYSRETFIGVYRDFLIPKPLRPPLIALYEPSVILDRDVIKRPVCLGEVMATRANKTVQNTLTTGEQAIHAPVLLPLVTSLSDIVWYYCPSESESIGPVSLDDLKGYVEMGMLSMTVRIHLSESRQKWELQHVLAAKEQQDQSHNFKSTLASSYQSIPPEKESTTTSTSIIENFIPVTTNLSKCEHTTSLENEYQEGKYCNDKQDPGLDSKLHADPFNVGGGVRSNSGKSKPACNVTERAPRSGRRSRQAKNKPVCTSKSNVLNPSSTPETDRAKYAPKPGVWKNIPTMIAGVLTEASKTADNFKNIEDRDIHLEVHHVSDLAKAIDEKEVASNFPRGNAWATPLQKSIRTVVHDNETKDIHSNVSGKKNNEDSGKEPQKKK